MLLLVFSAIAGPAADFVGGPLPAAPPLPLELAPDPMAAARLADIALIMLGAVAVGAAGVSVSKGEWRTSSTPRVMMAAWFLLVMVLLDPAFWKLRSVVADEQGVELRWYSGEPERLQWAEVSALRVEEGGALPLVQDDTRLVLEGKDGRRLSIPRFLPGVEGLAAVAEAKVPR